MPTQFFEGQLRGKLLKKLAPFEKFRSTTKDEARTGGEMWMEVIKRHHGNNTV